ncbi:MAG: CDP-diacylglycerol--serine O-phosphatidyltransferase [Elusimicrobiota bacterium]|nr:CDP-diacylglycerol--serine O-phosphatidyltransferase [Endomicrobiia bacterium]MDW8165789.1 CDP-diacylglycerol--serine O-phosphatidyltransferase [Elusimicrobiota bacterium]
MTTLYLFPTIFTAGNMFCGVLSIILSIKGNFTEAAWLIILGIIFDGLDGLIAREKKITSEVGMELDSFADFITFCISPAVLIWQLIMYRYKFPGVVVCFVYVFFGAIRLAKFNVVSYRQQGLPIKSVEGLPTPAAAGVIVSVVLLFGALTSEGTLSKRYITFLITLIPWMLNFLPAIILFLAFLMITKIRYPKLNNFRLTQKVSFKLFSLILIVLLLFISYPESSAFIIFSIYILYGLVEYLFRSYKIFKERKSRTINE